MPEYGREYWEANHVERRLTPEQLVEIAEGHIEREERLLLDSDRYLFVDTNAITTYVFAKYYHQSAHPRLIELAQQAEYRYEHVILCNTDIPYDNSWCRSGEANQTDMHRWTLRELESRKIHYTILPPNLDQRISLVSQIIAS